MLVSTKLTLWSNSDQVSESWEVQWKYYWGDVVWSGDVIWIREYTTHRTQHCAFGCKNVFFLTFYIHLQCKGCGVVWRKWFSVFEGFINAIWWQKHQFMFGCIVSADKIEKCIVYAGDWARDGEGEEIQQPWNFCLVCMCLLLVLELLGEIQNVQSIF